MRLNTQVNTPKGQASFIAYLEDDRVQVSRMVPATELTRDECTHRKPGLVELSSIEFINWQRSAKFCINEIYSRMDVTL